MSDNWALPVVGHLATSYVQGDSSLQGAAVVMLLAGWEASKEGSFSLRRRPNDPGLVKMVVSQ
jgi:hypothetical protein